MVKKFISWEVVIHFALHDIRFQNHNPYAYERLPSLCNMYSEKGCRFTKVGVNNYSLIIEINLPNRVAVKVDSRLKYSWACRREFPNDCVGAKCEAEIGSVNIPCHTVAFPTQTDILLCQLARCLLEGNSTHGGVNISVKLKTKENKSQL